MAAPAKTKPLSRRPSKGNVDPANHTFPSEIRSSAAFRAPPEPYYSLDTSIDNTGSKKRKIERACDFCRRRKTKCDGPKMAEFRCTNCIQNGRECTYVEVSKPRGPPKAYIQGMEDRIERLEVLLKRLRPEIDLTEELGPSVPRDSWKSEAPPIESTPSRQTSLSSHSQPSSSLVPPQPTLAVSSGTGVSHAAPYPGSGPIMIALTHATSRDTMRSSPGSSEEDEPSSASSSDNEDYGELSLIRGMQNLNIRPLESHEGGNVPDSQWRFHGKSSSFKLINTAWKLQTEASKVTGEASPENSAHKMGINRRAYFWKSPEYEAMPHSSDVSIKELLLKRFPGPDLLPSIMDGYFNVMNDHFPLLHRPTFERQLEDRLYERDIWFGSLCMAVFGVGARWSKLPGVLWDDDKGLSDVPDSSSPLWGSAGWKYIQVTFEIHRNHSEIILPACLFEIQSYHLIGLFLRSTSYYSDAWKIVSLGLRRAQDVGAHRKKVYSRNRTAEDELWKRAYWCLVTFDRLGSVINGRPCASRDEDSDLEMPLQVDDEYWETGDPNTAFRQPPDKPCRKAFFVSWIKLTQIAGFALRTLYAIGKSKIPLGLVGTRWREETLARLNDALSQWVEDLPPYLRWSTKVKDDLFATQATTLVTTYYMVVIFIHKPFIPMPFAAGSLGGFQSAQRHSLVDRPDFPWTCLSICTNAAKATAQIWNAHVQHRRFINMTSLANSSYISAGVLLVHIWLVRAMEKAQGPRVSDERKKFFTDRMNDLMEHLQILITRLEEISSGFEIARAWLKEIKNSLPPEGLSPQPSPSQTQTDSFESVNNEKAFSMETPYDFSRPETFGSADFSPNIPTYAMNTAFPARQDELAYAVPSTNSLVASTPMAIDSSSSLANALYPFNPAQSWEASRTDNSQLPISAARRFSHGQLFQSAHSASRGLMRRASLAPTGTTTETIGGSQAESVQSLRQHRSSSDLHGFTPTVPSQSMPSPYTASDHSSLAMDQQSSAGSSASHYGQIQSQYSMYQPDIRPSCLKREHSNSSMRDLYTPMDSPAMPMHQSLHSTSPSPMLHASRSQGSLHQQWTGNYARNPPVYRGEGSWRNYAASHASNPDLKGRRNSSFSPHPNPHQPLPPHPSYSPHSHSPHSHTGMLGPSGLPGITTPPELQQQQQLPQPPPHPQYGPGTLYTPTGMESEQPPSGSWTPRHSFSGPS